MRQWLVLVTSLAAATTFAQTPPLTFKGVEFGHTTKSELTAKFPGSQAFGNSVFAEPGRYVDATCGTLATAIRDNSVMECRKKAMSDGWSELFRVGATSAGSYWFDIRDDKVEGVNATFTTPSFPTISGALTEKYGKPASEGVESVQNRAGAKFQSTVMRWKLPDGEIEVEERSGKIDEMRLRMKSNKLLASQAEEATKKAKEAVHKL